MADSRCDVLIIGAGPSGIFTALELIRENSNKTITIVEQGKHRQTFVSQKQNGKMRQLQTLLQYHDGFFGRGRVFRR